MKHALITNLIVCVLLGLSGKINAAAPTDSPDTLVVCPRDFLPALRPWLVHRMQQGRRVVVSTDTTSFESIRRTIRKVAEEGELTHVLLVGDDHPRRDENARMKELTLPAQQIDAKINVKFGSEPQIGSDNGYADIDDDHLPDLAIGRLPVDTPEQLAVVVEKIIAYETAMTGGPWRRRVNITAGVGGFGVIADSIIEMATKKFITGGIPSGFQTKMTYASINSPYCPDPRKLPASLIDRHNEGCLFWVYIGHGQRQYLDFMKVDFEWYRIFDQRDVPQLQAKSGSPIAVMLACYTGAFDEEKDCLSEMMLAKAGGPVAVISGSRVTMPYGNTVFGQALLKQYFQGESSTLGELIQSAKRDSMATEKISSDRALIDAVGRAFSPTGKQLDEERREHLYLYNLIGDPLLVVRRPQEVKVDVPTLATAMRAVEVTGNSPVAGRCTVELVCRRDRLTFDKPARDGKVTPEVMSGLTFVYQRANDQRWSSQTLEVEAGEFQTRIHIPEDCIGACHVRVFIEGDGDFALGAADIHIHPQQADAAPFEAPPK